MEEATIVEDGTMGHTLVQYFAGPQRRVSGIVDLTVALKEENGLMVTNSNAKNKDLNHFF